MSDANVSDANPYSAPEAALDTGYDDTYDPSVISFNGRIGRMRYLSYNMGANLIMMAVMVPMLGGIGMMAGDPSMGAGVGIAYVAINIVALVFAVMWGKRRLNDLNRSGWWILLLIVPLVNLALIIYMLFFRGAEGANNFGPAPAENSVGVKILFWLFIVFFVGGIGAAILLPAMMGISA